jgi:two-component system OmpR family response regulator
LLRIDRDTYSVSARGLPIAVTAAEFDLLLFLVDNQHRVVSASEIAQTVFHARAGDTALLVRVHICNLRRAIQPCADAIVTIRGRGYRFLGG